MTQANSNPNVKYQWQQAVLDAFMEFRSEVLAQKINEAQRAISARLCEATPTDPDEQAAIRDALQTLRMLMGERNQRDPAEESQKKNVA